MALDTRSPGSSRQKMKLCLLVLNEGHVTLHVITEGVGDITKTSHHDTWRHFYDIQYIVLLANLKTMKFVIKSAAFRFCNHYENFKVFSWYSHYHNTCILYIDITYHDINIISIYYSPVLDHSHTIFFYYFFLWCLVLGCPVFSHSVMKLFTQVICHLHLLCDTLLLRVSCVHIISRYFSTDKTAWKMINKLSKLLPNYSMQ